MCINEMTKAERIAKFIEKHSIIDQSYFPETWLTWKAKKDGEDIYKFYNTRTGEVLDKAPSWACVRSDGSMSNGWYKAEKNHLVALGKYAITKGESRMVMNTGSNCACAYFKYDEELQVMVFATARLDTHRYNRKVPQEENIRDWAVDNYWSVLFFFRGDKTPYNQDGSPATIFNYGESSWRCPYSKFTVYYFKEWLKHFKALEIIKQSTVDFEKFARGTLYGSCGRAMNPAYTYDIVEWFNKPVGKKISKGKVGKMIDALCGREFKDLQYLATQADIIPMNEGYETRYNIHSNDVIYVDLDADPEWACLRYLYRKNDNFLDESYRVFVHEDGRCLMAKKNGPDDWSHATNIDMGWNRTKGRIVNYEDMKKHKRLSYISDMLETCWEPEKRLGKLIIVIKHPIIEQLYKSGYTTICKSLTSENKVNQNITNQFGSCDMKEKTLFGKLGVNKFQLDMIEKLMKTGGDTSYYRGVNGYSIIADTKTVTRENNISCLDNETFTELVEIIQAIKRNTYRSVADSFLLPDSLNFSLSQTINFWRKMAKIGKKHTLVRPRNTYYYGRSTPESGTDMVVRLIRDTLQNYNQLPLELAPPLPLGEVSSVAELERLHDSISRYAAEKRLEIQDAKNREKEAKMAKLDEKRKILEYEDDEFIIKLPKKLSEIILEGQRLSHCVGGYTENHANGNTTIMFLRKKSDEDTSFYTIEIRGGDKDKRIQQIHGKHNRWLGNNPEVVPFVMRWLRDKKIFCSDEILLSTAKGYSGYGTTLIPKPVI